MINNKNLRIRLNKIRSAQTVITEEINSLYGDISELIINLDKTESMKRNKKPTTVEREEQYQKIMQLIE